MNCPKCELPALHTQKYCRSCGTTLQVITKPLDESFTALGLEKSTHGIAKGSKHRPQNLMLGGFMTLFIGLAIVIISGTLIQDKFILGIGMLIVLAGMFLIGVANLWRRSIPKYSFSQLPEETLGPSQTTVYLDQERSVDFVPSITERTTNLLQYSAATKSNQQED